MNADKAMQRVGRVSRLEATASRTQIIIEDGSNIQKNNALF
jgi:hypothetical protein